MSTSRRFAAAVASLVLATVALFPASAGAQDNPVPVGPSGAEISTMFGVDGSLGEFEPSSAGTFVDSGMALTDIDPASGALVVTDAGAALSDQMAMLNDLAVANELNNQALAAAERARLEALRKRGGRLPASVPYADLFEAAGAARGVDPALLAAVAQIESNFAPEVIECRRVSSAGAKGLMQFMPDTAAGLGVNPCDPASAIDGAARLLAGLYAEWGDWDQALAAYNAGSGNVRKNGTGPYRGYITKVRSTWDSYAAMRTDNGEAQGEVGPEGCPTSSAGNTLRRGSEAVGVYELCKRSVAQARTPAAANAIKMALSPEFLGKPYSQPKRNDDGWYDCSSFVTRAYTRSGTRLVTGWPPTTASMTSGYPWARRISYSEAKPGDLILSNAPGHVGMLLADGYWVHTNRTGDISHVTVAPTSPDLSLTVEPDKA